MPARQSGYFFSQITIGEKRPRTYWNDMKYLKGVKNVKDMKDMKAVTEVSVM